MRINATEQTRTTRRIKARPKQNSGGTFVPQDEGAGQSTAPAATTSATPVPSIESLIVLQEGDDFRRARHAATKRADALLDALSDVRLGLLEGTISHHALRRLTTTLSHERANTGDLRLEAVLNDVEVRAEVEKAKLDSIS